MCFSSQASIISAIVLLIIGIASIKKAHPHKSLYPFALLPIFFGIQQALEWLIWSGFSGNNSHYIFYGSLGFLFFALIFWPVWIPFCVYSLETNPKRKQILKLLIAVGIVCSIAILYLGCCSFTTLLAQDHVQYAISGLETHPYLLSMLYVTSTILPFFVTSYHLLWIFGLGLFFSFIASITMFAGTIISIWCFFSAILSVLVWIIVCNLAQHKYH
jgi:hypothetical protein